MSDQDEWSWYSGFDEESYGFGPFGSRQEALADVEGYDRTIYLVEARKATVFLADYIDTDRLIEEANESAYDLMGEDAEPLFEISAEAESDLLQRLKTAALEWQAYHKLKFIPWRFTETRNAEAIAPPSADAPV